jgi:hypothetical protein
VVGILDRDTFMTALSDAGRASRSSKSCARSDRDRLARDGRAALLRLQENGSKTLPVTHNGQLVGLVTSENITEYLMIRSALRTAGYCGLRVINYHMTTERTENPPCVAGRAQGSPCGYTPIGSSRPHSGMDSRQSGSISRLSNKRQDYRQGLWQ